MTDDRSAAGSALVSIRWAHAKTYTLVCQQCGAAFDARHQYAKYCGNKCRQRAKYQRAKEIKRG